MKSQTGGAKSKEKGKEVDVEMASIDENNDGGDMGPPGTQSDAGYEVTDDIYKAAFTSPSRTRPSPSSPLLLRSPFARVPAASITEGGQTSQWKVPPFDFTRRLEEAKSRISADEAMLEKYARALPSVHPKPNPLRTPAPPRPSQAPNEDAAKIGEMAFEQLATLYSTASPDSAARSSAVLLDAHMSNLVWIQSRLINHYENLVRSRNLIQKTIDSISIAAFTQTRATEFAQMFQGEGDAEENPYEGLVERNEV